MHLIKAINEKANISNDEQVRTFFQCEPDMFTKNVVIAPRWGVEILNGHVDYIKEITKDMVYSVGINNNKFTYVVTGMGASLMGDAVLALALTECENMIFIGSVGGLCEEMDIGDIVIPEYSICGEGFSRYLEEDLRDCFGECYYPDNNTNLKVINSSNKLAVDDIKVHKGYTFSIDTITGEYANLDKIISLGSNSIEMETSAFFKATKYSDIKAAAILLVIDNTITNKSLYNDRTENLDKKKKCKFDVIPKIIIDLITTFR